VGRVLMYGHRGHAAHRIVAFHGNMVTGQLLRSSHHRKHSPKNQSFRRALPGYRLASSQKRQPTSEPVDHIDFRFWAGGMCASPRRTSIPLYSPVFLLGIFIFAVSLYFLGSGSPVMALIQSQPLYCHDRASTSPTHFTERFYPRCAWAVPEMTLCAHTNQGDDDWTFIEHAVSGKAGIKPVELPKVTSWKRVVSTHEHPIVPKLSLSLSNCHSSLPARNNLRPFLFLFFSLFLLLRLILHELTLSIEPHQGPRRKIEMCPDLVTENKNAVMGMMTCKRAMDAQHLYVEVNLAHN
jgi:hypothetical protein